MHFSIRSPQILEQRISLYSVAEAKARHLASMFHGASSLREFEAKLKHTLLLLCREAQAGRLISRTRTGDRLNFEEILKIEGLQFSEGDIDNQTLQDIALAVFTPLKALNEWAAVDGDSFSINSSGVGWIGRDGAYRTDKPLRIEVSIEETTEDTEDIDVCVQDMKLYVSPEQLCIAFGRMGLKSEWFKDLNSHTWLKDAKFNDASQLNAGKRGKPKFHPKLVMEGLLTKSKFGKSFARSLAEKLMKHHFQQCYDKYYEVDSVYRDQGPMRN